MKTRDTSRRFRSGIGAVALGAMLLVATTGCDSFFEIRTPGTIEASTVDPVQDGEMFSRSAFQTFASAYGNMIIYTAWFSGEAWVGDTFPTRNEFGRRLVDDRNGTWNGVWSGLVRGIAQAEQVMEILGGEPGMERNLARAAFASGYSLVLQAEALCTGTFRQEGGEPGGEFTPDQMLNSAIERLDQAITWAGQASGAEATGLLNASRVTKGRALLNLGQAGAAVSAVSGVPTDFVFNIPYVDDAGNRGRLGNGVYLFSAGGSRESLVVPGPYLEMDDPRIPWIDAGRDAQDGVLRFFSQRKFDNWAAPIPAASGLEARYIEVEARNDPVEMLAFANERRAVGGQDPIVLTDPGEIFFEFMDQHSRDFWLEARRMGAWRRNGDAAVPYVLPPGDNYYKPAVGTVSNQACLPLPFGERNANPNISGG